MGQQIMPIQYDFVSKIILVGNTGAGKTSIITRYTLDQFKYNTSSTTGLDHCVKSIKVNDQKIKLLIWDTAGQEKYRSLSSSTYKQSSGIIFVFEVTSQKSLSDIQIWLSQAKQYVNQNVPKILVGNKTDLQWQINKKQAQDLAMKHNMKCFFTSALNKNQISQLFNQLCCQIIKAKTELKQDKKPKEIPKGQPLTKQRSVDKKPSSRLICPFFKKLFK